MFFKLNHQNDFRNRKIFMRKTINAKQISIIVLKYTTSLFDEADHRIFYRLKGLLN